MTRWGIEKMVDLYSLLASDKWSRIWRNGEDTKQQKIVHSYRLAGWRGMRDVRQRMLQRLRSDRQLLAFHLGETQVLPDLYKRIYTRQLGRYAELMPLGESAPLLEPED
jgi:hypothetical protein